MISYIALQWLMQTINQNFYAQNISPSVGSQASYGMFIVRILEKIDCVMMAPHCIIRYDSYVFINDQCLVIVI